MSQGCTIYVEEIQSWWEVPAIAHFCSLFRTAFNLPDFEIEVKKFSKLHVDIWEIFFSIFGLLNFNFLRIWLIEIVL